VLSSGAIDVTVSWGEALALDINTDRKQTARNAEAAVRRMMVAALRAGSPQPSVPTGAMTLGTAGISASNS
jgi:1-acyl-sn-glycerol-3-phosphate acyltransferase